MHVHATCGRACTPSPLSLFAAQLSCSRPQGVVLLTFGDKEMWWGLNYLRKVRMRMRMPRAGGSIAIASAARMCALRAVRIYTVRVKLSIQPGPLFDHRGS